VGKDNKDFFWPSYVDLLTALFTIVLVLFILSFKLFKDKTDELKIEKDKLQVLASQYERIKKIDTLIRTLESSGTFKYDSINKRFLVQKFTGEEIFESFSENIKPQFYKDAEDAGKEIIALVNSLYDKHKVKLLVIIEGNTARQPGSPTTENTFSYDLSYRRALALKSLWITQGIVFDSKKSELLIAGSGLSGIDRSPTENNNKRFLIQIIPKIEK
jgi:outer membrane protein OmpA-like peptidoglycan-associated protein